MRKTHLNSGEFCLSAEFEFSCLLLHSVTHVVFLIFGINLVGMKLSRQQLQKLAGSRSFDRGEDYFLEGRVSDLEEDSGIISAIVRGRDEYEVELRPGKPRLTYSCDCPVGDDGDFCKHLVATGLAWIKQNKERGGNAQTWKASEKKLRAYLDLKAKSAVVELLLRAAKENRDLREKLLLEVARTSPEGIDLAAFRRTIEAATKTGGLVEYHKMSGFVRRLKQVIESIGALFEDGQVVAVIELTEFMLEQLEGALGEVDDSAGHMHDILDRLQTLHYEACVEARPDPVKLARRLFERELTSEWEIFYGAAESYADMFGDEGLAEYRRLTEAAWAEVPNLGPKNDSLLQFRGSRFRLTSMMEKLARQSDDPEALVEIKRRDLSSSSAYVQIAEIYQRAGRTDQAIEWAEQGLAAFPRRDSRLVHFLADEYHRRDRHDAALDLIWREFTETSTLGNYQLLAEHALKIAPTPDWPTWREKALAHLRGIIARAQAKSPSRMTGAFRSIFDLDHTSLVEIFMWEERYEEAWQEATIGGCSDSWWIKVANQRGKEHPADAIPVYRRLVGPLIKQLNNSAYETAIILIRKIRELMIRLEQGSDFSRYLITVRAEFRSKRNFIGMLDQFEREIGRIPSGKSTAGRTETVAGTENQKMFDD